MKKLVKTLFFMVTMVGLLFVVSAQAMMSVGGSSGTMGTFMQMPTGHQMFEYGPTTAPVVGSDVSTTMPLGVGPVAMGGNTITVHAAVGQFSSPMDMYLTVYAPAVDPFKIYLMRPDGALRPASMGFEPWMTGVTSVDQTPVTNMPTSALPKGTYTIGLMATPAGGNMSTYYMWTTHFVVQ
ncbi:MAG: hypothetical protein M0Z71_07700 [Nitrospiraceae bacterium]|nr:hypothetical protein [Nitrospiraceae bacterium]